MERTLPRTQPAALTSRPTPAAWPLRLLATLLLWRPHPPPAGTTE